MKLLKKQFRGALCLLLAISLLGGTLLYAFGTAADDFEETMLGELSKDFESGDPGTISSGDGDPGGKSYGAFQFASKHDGPRQFFYWCLGSERSPAYQAIGARLRQAYIDDTSSTGYGDVFDAEWRAIAEEQHDTFLAAQRDYVEVSYYQQAVDDIAEAYPGFDISNYSIALRNVFLSRAVQHGSGGVVSVMDYVFAKLGGFKNQPETELIQAIYEESGEVREPRADRDEEVMEGSSAQKYGVAGKVMSWFWGSSADVQIGVYMRLRINEPAMAQNMLARYGYADAPIPEGVYRFSPESNANLSVVADGDSLTLNTTAKEKAQQFRFTYYASGYYIITNEQSGLRLTANTDGTLTMTAPTADNNQMWKLENLNSGFSVKNRATGHYLSTANAAAGDAVTGGKDAVQWQIAKSGSSWTLSGATYPTYANFLREGYGFNLRGTLRCVDAIANVTVSVVNHQDGVEMSVSTGPLNSRAFDLSEVDGDIDFGDLSAGSYTLVISATSVGDSDNTYRMESKFFVSDGKYLISFDACGGTASAETMTVLAGQAYGKLPTAAKDGYVFIGWFTQPDGGTQITANSTTGASNQVLYAQYAQALTYQFLNYDDSVFAEGQLRAGDVIPLPAGTPVRPADAVYYYAFAGWDGYSEGMTISENVSFKALFDAVAVGAMPEMVTEVYRIDGEWLRAIALGTKADTLHENLAPGEYITITKGSATVSDTAATGMTVEYALDGITVQKLTVVVTGDTNGDGKYTITDMVQIQAHLLGRSTLSGAALQAADLNGDGAVTITDMVQATSAMLGKTSIKPH